MNNNLKNGKSPLSSGGKIRQAYETKWQQFVNLESETPLTQRCDAMMLAALCEAMCLAPKNNYFALFSLMQTALRGWDGATNLSSLVDLSDYKKFISDVKSVREKYLNVSKRADSKSQYAIDSVCTAWHKLSSPYFRETPSKTIDIEFLEGKTDKISRSIETTESFSLEFESMKREIEIIIDRYNDELLGFNIKVHLSLETNKAKKRWHMNRFPEP